MTEEIVTAGLTPEKLEALREEHRRLDQKIKELTAVAYLTTDEQIEVARLKKRKLMMKDEIFRMATTLGVEP
jgi:hypothetical protein